MGGVEGVKKMILENECSSYPRFTSDFLVLGTVQVTAGNSSR